MAWSVLFWNIQGAARGNVKLDKVKEVIDLVKPDVVGFAEVGLNFPFDVFPKYTFQEKTIQDKHDNDTPKGLALGVLKDKLEFQSELVVTNRVLFTSHDMVKLTRPLLVAWVSGMEVVLVHAPSKTNGILGRVTVANVYDYFRDQCRTSKGAYKGFAIGDFNTGYASYKMAIDEVCQVHGAKVGFQRTHNYYYMITTCDPGWDMTQKSGGVLDYMITCGVVGHSYNARALRHDIANRLESMYLDKWPATPKQIVTKTGPRTLIRQTDPAADSIYNDVMSDFREQFEKKKEHTRSIPGWHIDHRPVVYEIMNAERGPLAPRVIDVPINLPTGDRHMIDLT